MSDSNCDPKLALFSIAQSERLGVFREWGFMRDTARSEYAAFLTSRCATEERVRQLMDAAILLEQMPTIADLNRIWNELYGVPPPAWSVEMSGEEREQQKQFMRDWHAQELAGIEQRREAFKRYQEKRASAQQIPAPLSNVPSRATSFEMDDAVKRWIERWHIQNNGARSADTE